MNYMWNKEKTGILVDRGEGIVAFLEGGEEFNSLKQSAPSWSAIEISTPILLDPAESLAAARAAMVASPAQIRLTLFQLGLLDTVQAIADSDPAAAIVWEYALEFSRTNALIHALAGDGFTPEQIDDIFRAAMAVKV